jgi:predicted  nucleic acid-binding Zn-ribbon protein
VNILNQALNQYITVEQNANAIKELVDAEIQAKAGDISSTAVTNLQSDVSAIQAQLEALQPIVNNITELTEISQIDVTELQQYGDNITQVTADLTSLQNQLTQLSNTVSSLSTNMNSTVSDAVQTVLQETTALDNKVE